MNTAQRIKQAKSDLQDKQTKKAELVGRRKTLMDRLWKDHNVRSVKAAESLIDELEDSIKENEKELKGKLQELDDMQEKMEEKEE